MIGIQEKLTHKYAYKIIDPKIKQHFLNKLDRLNINLKTPKTVVIQQDKLIQLKHDHPENYLAKHKTSSYKYLLFITMYNYTKYCLFFDKRKKEFYSVKFRFDQDVFKDTILDGEFFTSDKNGRSNSIFYIDDVWYCCGIDVRNEVLSKRLTSFKNIIENKSNSDNNTDNTNNTTRYIHDRVLQICELKCRPYFNLHNLSKILTRTKIIVSMNYNDPIIIYNDFIDKKTDNIIESLPDENIIKFFIKHPNDQLKKNNNKIFKIRKTLTPDVYQLIDNNTIHSIAAIPTLEDSKFIRNLFNENKELMMECQYISKFNKWKPFKICCENEN